MLRESELSIDVAHTAVPFPAGDARREKLQLSKVAVVGEICPPTNERIGPLVIAGADEEDVTVTDIKVKEPEER